MRVRAFEEKDTAQVQALVAGINSDEYGFSRRVREDLVDIKQTYSGAFFVCDNGSIIGCVGLQRYKNDVKMRRMHVQKEHRRRGVGTALLERALQWAEQNSIERAYLSTDERMQEGIRFYETHGFTRLPQLPSHIPPDKGDTVFFMLNIKKKK